MAADPGMSDVVCFGQQNWDVCWTAKQQLCTRLAARGRRVLYIDPDPVEEGLGARDTLRSLGPARMRPGLREERPGLHIWTHVHSPPLGWRINHRLRSQRIAAVTRHLGLRDGVAIAIHPMARRHVGAARPRARIYYAVDEMTGFHDDPAVQRRLRREEELSIREADIVLSVSPKLHERFSSLHPRAYLLPNAADFDHFSPDSLASTETHTRLRGLARPAICLIGQIDERVDQPLLVHVARARPDWRLVLAGRVKPGVDVSALHDEPNIVLLGYQDYAALPSILRAVDVCMVPYHLTPLTHGCNPLKVWEYLATGLPVVSTPVDSLRNHDSLITLAHGSDAFLAGLDDAIANGNANKAARIAFARTNSWDHRVTELERHIDEAVRSAGEHESDAHAAAPPRWRRSWAGGRAEAHRSGGVSVRGRAGITERRERDDAERPTRALLVAYRLTRAAGRVYYALRLVGRALAGRPARVRRILVARRSRLGDTVVLLPLLRALRAHYPDAPITLGVQPGFAAGSILENETSIDAVRTIDVLDRGTRVQSLRALAVLFLHGWDLVVTGATYFLLRDAFLTGAPRIIGIDDGHPLQRLCDERVRMLPATHEAETNLALAELLGADIPSSMRAPSLTPPADGERRVAALLDALQVPADAPLIVMHPGAQKPSRRWPADRFGALAAALLAEHPAAHVLLTGVAEETELIDDVRAAIPSALRARAHDVSGRTDLRGLFALLDRCRIFVCNDTGTMHVARALGAPLVALLGPENDLRWGPHPQGRAPAVSLRHQVPCAPCTRWDEGGHWCMRSLSVAEATVAVRDVLALSRHVDQPVSLDRRARPAGWRALDAMDFALPTVTVTLAVDAGADPHGAGRAIERAIASLEAQTYPALDVVIALSNPAELPADLRTGRFEPRIVTRGNGRSNGASPAGMLGEAAAFGKAAAPGEVAEPVQAAASGNAAPAPAAGFRLDARAGHTWAADAIGRAVAHLVRSERAVAADADAAYVALDRAADTMDGSLIVRTSPGLEPCRPMASSSMSMARSSTATTQHTVAPPLPSAR
jgi:ADP-heptose:LPS heptosyltransferase/glycosyltransferase involved in cell wall biosynthesis